MSYRELSRFAALCIALLPVVACAAPKVEEEVSSRAFKVEPIEGTDLSRVILTPEAAQRLDIQTAMVRSITVAGRARIVVPYAAILYDKEGHAWAYTNPESLAYVRTPLAVDYVEDTMAVLTEGPAVGIAVVTVGASELYGCEEEFEEE